MFAVPYVLRPAHAGWLRWATIIGGLGYSVIALQYLREIALIPPMAEKFVVADTSTRAATAANLYLVLLDPHGWLSYGAIGAWLLVINTLALIGSRWPRLLASAGIAGGIAYWLVVAGTVLDVESLVTVAAIAGVILAPITLIWLGLLLRKWSPWSITNATITNARRRPNNSQERTQPQRVFMDGVERLRRSARSRLGGSCKTTRYHPELKINCWFVSRGKGLNNGIRANNPAHHSNKRTQTGLLLSAATR